MLLDGIYTLTCSNVDGTITAPILTNPRYGTNQNDICFTVTPDLLPDTNTYCVTVLGAHSQANLVISPDPATCCFKHGSEYPLFHVLYKRYDDVATEI